MTDKYRNSHTHTDSIYTAGELCTGCLAGWGNSTGVPECMTVQRRLKLIVYELNNKLYIEVSYRTEPIELSYQDTQSSSKNTSAGQMFVDTDA